MKRICSVVVILVTALIVTACGRTATPKPDPIPPTLEPTSTVAVTPDPMPPTKQPPTATAVVTPDPVALLTAVALITPSVSVPAMSTPISVQTEECSGTISGITYTIKLYSYSDLVAQVETPTVTINYYKNRYEIVKATHPDNVEDVNKTHFYHNERGPGSYVESFQVLTTPIIKLAVGIFPDQTKVIYVACRGNS